MKINPPAPAEISAAIEEAWIKELESSGSGRYKANNVYASAYSVCVREMVLNMTHGDQLPVFDADALARFKRGKDRERDLMLELTRVGVRCGYQFDVTGQQELFRLLDRKGRIAVSGKVDGRVTFKKFKVSAPIESKAWSPFLTDRIHVFEDVFKNYWTRRGGVQILSYLLGSGEPLGFLLLDRSGLPKLLPVELNPHLDRLEKFLTDAETAMDHKEKGTLPPFVDDLAECERCQHRGINCQPPIKNLGAAVLTDPELEAMLDRREQLRAAALEYDGLDGDLKKRLRGVELGLCGSFLVKGKWSAHTKYEVPEEIRLPYKKTDPKGKFTLEIQKV